MSKQRTEKQVERLNSLKEAAKNLIAPAVFLAIIGLVALLFTLIKPKTSEIEEIKVHHTEDADLKDQYVLENQYLKLTLDGKTTQFTLLMKETGEIWYSNPPELMAEDAATSGVQGALLESELDKIKSTIFIESSDKKGSPYPKDNFRYSIVNQNYEIEADDNQIKIYYSIGEVAPEYYVPLVMPAAEMEEYYEKLETVEGTSPTKVSLIKSFYQKFDMSNIGDDKLAELQKKYETITAAEGEVYILLSGHENNKKMAEPLFAAAGFTAEEYKDQVDKYGASSNRKKPVFNVNMIYRLDDRDLTVEVPYDEMEFREMYPITKLSILPYFGAANQTENGYIMLPEGGGSLIRFNNGKTTQSIYKANLYGWDYASKRESMIHETRLYYNVFGIAKNGGSFLCILEDGAPYVSIEADIPRKAGGYNYVSPIYAVLHSEGITIGSRANGAIYYYEKSIPKEKVSQRYRFVTSESYVDMANAYRDYLLEKYEGALTKKTDTDVPVAVELIGAVDKTKQILGVPVSRPLVVTTYKEAQSILEDLNSNGVKNMSVKLSGWTNGGVNQSILKKVKLVSGLGGGSKLKSLTKYASDNQMNLYLNGYVNYEHDSDLKDGFVAFRDAACFANKKRTELYEFDTVHFGENKKKDTYYLLKPSLTIDCMENLSAAAKKYNAGGVSFADVGYHLSADYNRANTVTRQAALNMQIEQIKKIKDSGQKVMINMGNDYMLPYADLITNMDLKGVDYSLLDESVPFYQIAIHGYVDYTGEPLNLTQNYEDELLRSAEYGAGLSFTFMDAEITELQDTYYSHYFGANYDGWKDEFFSIYNRYEKELGSVFAQTIKDHKILDQGVRCTQYEDGTKVYVNYSFKEVKADGVTVPARDYLVVR